MGSRPPVPWDYPSRGELHAAQVAVRDGNISNIWTVTLYNQWTAFCADLQLDHLFGYPNLPL